MGQKFYADPRAVFEWPNGAKGYRPTSGPFDCLGPYAKVTDCPIAGTTLRRTCYATGYADTFFSVPACTRINGKYVAGYFSTDGGLIEFRTMDRHKDRLPRLPDSELIAQLPRVAWTGGKSPPRTSRGLSKRARGLVREAFRQSMRDSVDYWGDGAALCGCMLANARIQWRRAIADAYATIEAAHRARLYKTAG
jgi:hypothetical protein